MATTKIKYMPYTGGAGPDVKHQDNNTKYLGLELKKLGISSTEDKEFAKENWGGNEINLKIKHPTMPLEDLYIGYDRWGFCCDELSDDIDQASLEASIEAVKIWYNQK